jgi:ATP-binding cassette subfamily F protein 2
MARDKKEPKKEKPLRGRRLKKAEEAAAAAAGEEGGAGGWAPADADSARTATGVLASEKRARDIKIQSFSLSLFGNILVEDTTIELNYGQRYGLIGANGCGKSTLLKCLCAKEVPIPETTDVYLLAEEAQPSELSALDWVIDAARQEVARLEADVEHTLQEEGPDSDRLVDLYDALDALDPTTFESRASKILLGLGYTPETLHKRTCDMSGGWRMRVALAKALFIQPTLLLLDEPTNHLDLEACVWLENYLATYRKILVVISHSQDFLNGVCTNIMVMQNRQLRYWGGNYDTYMKTRSEQDANQLKLYKKQQEEIAHTKAFIASCGTYSNLIRQGKSRQKQLDKMIEAGLIEKPFEEITFRLRFPDSGTLPPPVISFTNVAFSYSGKKEDYLFKDLSFGVDSDSRIALVGPNGAGKSTLLKLIVGDIFPCEGNISVRTGCSIGRFHQHSADHLDYSMTPIEYIQKNFNEKYPESSLQDWRSRIGQFGISGKQQVEPIGNLSDGLKTRLAFCEIALQKPHILLCDEPTNHADLEYIDSMADAINHFAGGVIVISHDFRLLQQVAKEIWVVDKGLTVWDGDIMSYKKDLIGNMNMEF